MSQLMYTRKWAFAAAAVITVGWGLNQATAGLPALPPFVTPPPVIVPPPINEPPPPIHSTPPPVAKTPEPATMVLGLIGAGIAGLVTRRRKRVG
jgi:LPXTG-motif cell wall-anchored protein